MTALAISLRTFAYEHDDIPAFHAAFLVVSILSAAVFNLGFFGLAIGAHMALDFVKYYDIHRMSLSKTFKAMILESVHDIALFLIALTFSVYLNHAYMLSAVSGLLRSQLTILRALGTLIPKIRIMDDLMAIGLNMHNYLRLKNPSVDWKLNRLEKWSIRTIIACTALLLFAIVLFHMNEWDLLMVLRDELVPSL